MERGEKGGKDEENEGRRRIDWKSKQGGERII